MYTGKSTVAAMRTRGFTLVELIFFIVVVSVALAGVLNVINVNTNRAVDPQIRKQALAIAEGLLDEIELAHFTFCDPTDPLATTATSTAGCTNANYAENFGQESTSTVGRPFDNVNDYVTAAGTPATYNTDIAGNAIPTGYTATVTMNPDAGLGPAGSQISSNATAAGMNVLRITVTVTYTGGSVTLDGYRVRYAPNYVP